MRTPYCDEKGKPCSFEVWQAAMKNPANQVSWVEVKIGKDTFIVWTRFKGFLIYSWKKGKLKKPKNKNAFQTTVDLPAGVPFDPSNPNHVKYYNKKFKEDGKGKADKKQKDIEKEIKKGKPIKEDESINKDKPNKKDK